MSTFAMQPRPQCHGSQAYIHTVALRRSVLWGSKASYCKPLRNQAGASLSNKLSAKNPTFSHACCELPNAGKCVSHRIALAPGVNRFHEMTNFYLWEFFLTVYCTKPYPCFIILALYVHVSMLQYFSFSNYIYACFFSGTIARSAESGPTKEFVKRSFYGIFKTSKF